MFLTREERKLELKSLRRGEKKSAKMQHYSTKCPTNGVQNKQKISRAHLNCAGSENFFRRKHFKCQTSASARNTKMLVEVPYFCERRRHKV